MTSPSPPTAAGSEPARAQDSASTSTAPALSPEAAVQAVSDFRRALRLGWRAAGRGVVEFYNSENLTFAASIGYYTLLSFFPFLLLILSLVSRFAIGGDEQAIAGVVERTLPRSFEPLVKHVALLASTPLQLSVAGTLITLWASMGVFGAVTSAVNHAWGVEQAYGFFKHKLVAFLMLAASGCILIAAVFLVAAVQIIEANWFAGVVRNYPALHDLRTFAVRNAPTPMVILVMGFIYYYVPNAQVRLRDVWFGAIVSGLLWRLAFSGFAWYVADLSRFSVHGSIGVVVAFLIWVYLQAVILLYGVEVTAAYARLRKHLPQASPAAPAREG